MVSVLFLTRVTKPQSWLISPVRSSLRGSGSGPERGLVAKLWSYLPEVVTPSVEWSNIQKTGSMVMCIAGCVAVQDLPVALNSWHTIQILKIRGLHTSNL